MKKAVLITFGVLLVPVKIVGIVAAFLAAAFQMGYYLGKDIISYLND